MSLPVQTTQPALAEPSFHAAPLALAEPSEVDADEPTASAHQPPHQQQVSPQFALLGTRHLTAQILEEIRETGTMRRELTAEAQGLNPLAATATTTVYTPAQIRAAYALPALPTAGATVTSAQAVQFGAGQTIYIVDAHDDPNIAAELAAFNTKFGLPGCNSVSIATNTTLPLPAASSSGCSFSVVHSTGTGALTATVPSYDSGWAAEIALDVQWAHATAPYARIILIESPDNGLPSLSQAVALANSMGPGVVSMSWGSAEAGPASSLDGIFVTPNMTYLASTGDSGSGVQWPAVSSRVVGVSGTTLTYGGTTARSEAVWSGTGGGISAYTPAPAYQSTALATLGSTKFRSVSDVAFNADPNSGQYVAIIPQGKTAVTWMAYGGTSIAAPQWAGVFSIVNAMRVQSGLAVVGEPHAALYQIAAQSKSYASNFLDITHGADGSCASCYATTGYDLPSGIGTPNVGALLSALAAVPASAAPVVKGASVSGTVGTALSFSVSATASHPVTYLLSGAPSGLTVDTTGLVTWPAPVVGTYTFALSAIDTQTGSVGQGQFTITIAQPANPVFKGAQLSGTAGSAMILPLTASAPNPVTFSAGAMPAGMSVSSKGLLSWPSPVAGSYAVTITVQDSKTLLTGSGTVNITIALPPPPVVAAQTLTGTAGTAFSVQVQASGSNSLSYALTAAPAGMSINASGVVSWPNPVAGTYNVTVTATDTRTGVSGKAVLAMTFVKPGPSITATTLTGVTSKTLAGTISIADATSSKLTVTIKGVPAGMTSTPSGSSVQLQWAKPVVGSYSLQVTVTDGAGLSATATVPVSITKG